MRLLCSMGAGFGRRVGVGLGCVDGWWFGACVRLLGRGFLIFWREKQYLHHFGFNFLEGAKQELDIFTTVSFPMFPISSQSYLWHREVLCLFRILFSVLCNIYRRVIQYILQAYDGLETLCLGCLVCIVIWCTNQR